MRAKILYLTTVLPRKRRTGGEIASDSFLKAIQAAGYEVITVGYLREGDAYSVESNEVGVEARPIETTSAKRSAAAWMLKSFLTGLPYSSAKFHSRAYIKKVLQVLETDRIALVIIEHSQLGWMLKHLPNRFPRVFNTQNIENEIYLEAAREQKNPFMAWIYRRESRLIKAIEDNLARACAQVWTLTSKDRDYFAKVAPSTGVYEFPIPAAFKSPGPQQAQKQYDIGILGTWTWKSNAEGLHWFFDAVYPLLPKSISIRIAGKGADWLTTASFENVTYCGFVPDALSFLNEAKVVAIPSIAGGGIQIKTLDAIATGATVVATSFALRGIEEPPASVTIANSPEVFAERLLDQISLQGGHKVQNHALKWSEDRRTTFYQRVQETLADLLTGKEMPS